MKQKILVVDDDAVFRSLLNIILVEAGYQVLEAPDATTLKTLMEGPAPEVVLLDLMLPDARGMDLLPLIKKSWPMAQVIILTGYATYEAAVKATKLGAYDFQKKPVDPKSLQLSIEHALEQKELVQETHSLRQALTTISGVATPIFQSTVMQNVIRTAQRIGPSDVSVLITGESGAGKEVIADLLHALSPKSKGPFVKINCAALPRELIESELFGSMKGAFTGAQCDREGLFQQAAGGTLLLDELSEMPVDTQSKLLRVLQEKEFRPVGGRASFKADCRVIAATNRIVEEALRDGKLREDLYYRISTITIHLPPLRERRMDIMPLANAFLKRFTSQAGQSITGFTPEAAEVLSLYDWPGNVRQLQNEIQRAMLMCDSQLIGPEDLSISVNRTNPNGPTLTLMEAMERNTIRQILTETNGNKVETAKRLGIGRQTLYNKLKAYAIDVPEK